MTMGELSGAAGRPAAARCAGPGGGAATQARARWPHQRARLLLHATCCHYPAASISNTVCALFVISARAPQLLPQQATFARSRLPGEP